MDPFKRSVNVEEVAAEPESSMEAIEARYNQNMFLDAYALCRKDYNQIDNIKNEDVRKIILLGRLAGRLGSRKILNQLFSIAREKAPEDPLVHYFAGRSANSFEHLLRHLEEIETISVNEFENDQDKASWLASTAWIYAGVRDFERAHKNLSAALALNTEKAWVYCCQAEALCLEDRWPEGLTAAEKAWELSPGMPQAAATLGRIVAKSHGISAAVARLLDVAQQKQSFETLLTTIHYLCADAERHSGDDCGRLARQALALTDRLDSLAPLKDEDLKSYLALVNIDIAWLLKDHESMREQEQNVRHPFYQTILKNIENCTCSDVMMTSYRPVFQKHNTCLPTSAASVLAHFGREIDADALAKEMTYHGTAMWRVKDWLEQQDLIVRPFIADGDIAKTLLRNNLPFVLNVKSIYFYHSMAAIGVDEAAGVLLVHDPSNIRMDKMLLSELGKSEAPFGLEALAIAPREDAHKLDLIEDADSEPFSAYLQYQKVYQIKGPKQGRAVIDDLKNRYPGHPFVLRMEAIDLGDTGRTGAAIKRQEALLKRYPDCEHTHQELLNSLYRTGNRGLIRKVLGRIVLKKRLPGIRAAQKWQYPPAEYVSQYATYVGMVKSENASAVKMLWDAIEREPNHAASYHGLGDLHCQEANFKKSILPYRCAATLELENHHYARAYLDALAKVGGFKKGIGFLKRRTEKLGRSVAGGAVWMTLVDAYEDYGYPDEAIAAMGEALSQRSSDPFLLGCAVRFWGRMGYKKKEGECLSALLKTGHRPIFFSAATAFHRMSGNWREALNFCKQWLAEEPHNIEARREFVQLYAMGKGMKAALSLTHKWMRKNRGNDDFEMLYLEYLKSLYAYDLQLEVLRARLKRNPYDIWAIREQALLLIQVIDMGSDRDEAAIRDDLDKAITRCRDLSPEEAPTLVLEADWAACEGHYEKAVSLYKKAVMRDPEYAYAYHQTWYYGSKFPEDARKALFETLEKAMVKTTGFLNLSKDLAYMAAECFGSAEAHRIVDRWLKRFPGDPEITKAKANLLLQYGQGRTDAEKAAAMLEAEIVRFPNQADFQFILSRAYRILQDEAKWVKTSKAILKQFPLSSIQRRQLAEFYFLNNDPQRAKEQLKEGIRFRPLDGWVRFDLISLHFQNGEKDEALALVHKSLAIIPEDIEFRQRTVDLLFTNGEEQTAVAVAKAGTDVYPDGAVMWKHYGDALWRSKLTSDMKAVESAYLRALEFNPRLLDAADRLAQLYTFQNRFEDARNTILRQKPYHVEQGRWLTRLAWIERKAGNTTQAVDQLSDTLKRWPRERGAWLLLLEWIEADKNWKLAKRILRDVHPVMAEDPDFVCDKLYVLHQAGVRDTATEKEWKQLLIDFPENEKAHCLRFDILYEEEAFDEAEAVLKRIEKYEPTSPYLAARRVALKADQQQFDEAVRAALHMMKMPYDAGDWCRMKVRGAFKDYLQLPRLVGAAIQQWQDGVDIEPNCFRMIIDDIETIWKPPGRLARFLRKLRIQPRVVRRLKKLLAQSIQRDNQHGSYTAAVLSKLEDYGLRKFLIAFAKQNPEFAKNHTQVWQIIGHALVIGSKRESDRARKWLETWRDHQGCELWVVSNYLIAIENSRKLKLNAKLQLILESAEAAVQTLPADNLIQYVICKYCEAALRLGKDAQFLNWAHQYSNILRDSDSGFWAHRTEAHLPWAMLQFRQLLEADPKDILKLSKAFNKEVKRRSVRKWVHNEWKKRLKRIKKQGQY